MLLFALLACTDSDPVDTDPVGPASDPDVTSWSPDFAPLDEVSNVIFFGDSITAGYGIAQSDNAYRNLLVENNDNRWPEYAGDDLIGRYGDFTTYNYSRSGAQTPDVLNGQVPAMIDALGPSVTGPTLVFVTIGGNDLVASLTNGQLDHVATLIENNVEQIAATLTDPALFPDGVLLAMTNVYEPTDGTGQVDECFFGLDVSAAEPVLEDTNARMLGLAHEYGFAWVDLRGHFLGHGFTYEDATAETYHGDDPTLWFQSDCIHPNRRGHHELRRLFLAAIDNVTLPVEVPQ